MKKNINVPITVLMPVFNAQDYLKEAIDSILAQTYSKFEFLIINDGSTDGTDEILSTYKDKRIRIYKNKNNLGLVASLNRGINLSRGKFIARMDGDDVSYPNRLDDQMRYMEEHDCDVLAAKVDLINNKGKHIGYWDEDQKINTFNQIKNTLPKQNCIAHPTIFAKKSVLKKYKYNSLQTQFTEDYDLWLRLCDDGHRIEKIDKILLKYRIYAESSSKKTSSALKGLRTRLIFFYTRLKCAKVSLFDLKVLLYLFPEIFNHVCHKLVLLVKE